MVARIIRIRIGCKAACRAMLKALVDRQNDHFACPTQATVIEHAGQVGTDTSIVAVVPTQYLSDVVVHFLCSFLLILVGYNTLVPLSSVADHQESRQHPKGAIAGGFSPRHLEGRAVFESQPR